MNAIVKVPDTLRAEMARLPEAMPQLTMPRHLARWLDKIDAENPSAPLFERPGAIEFAAARARLPAVIAACDAVASPQIVGAWLLLLTAGRAISMSPDDHAVLTLAVHQACVDLPDCVFCKETQTAALRTFKFVPTPAEVYALLTSYARQLRRARRLLTQLLAEEDAAKAWWAREAEIEADHARMAAMTPQERAAHVRDIIARARMAD